MEADGCSKLCGLLLRGSVVGGGVLGAVQDEVKRDE